MKPPTYPARPINGGPLDKAAPKSGQWFYEPKYNGWRALVHIETGAMFNRKGEQLSIAKEFEPALKQLRATLDAGAFKWADCEALERRHGIGRGTLIVLDVIPEQQPDAKPGLIRAWREAHYTERREWLEAVLMPTMSPIAPGLPCGDNELCLAPRVSADVGAKDRTCCTLLEYWERLQVKNKELGCEFYEGLVAKRADSIYPIQRISPEREFPFWCKHRWAF